MENEIIGHFLMSEEETLICPLGGCKESIKDQGSDQLFYTTCQFGFVIGIDFVKTRVSWHGLELLNIGHVIPVLKFLWEKIVNVAVWLESQFERSNRIFLASSLVKFSHV